MIICDAHQDHRVIGRITKKLAENLKRQTSISLVGKNNINMFFYSIFPLPEEKNINAKIDNAINYAKREIEKSGMILIKNKNNLINIEKNKNITHVILHIEGLNGIKSKKDIEYIGKWLSMGVRSFGIVWNMDNFLGGSCYGNQKKGLTGLGRDVLDILNKNNAIIDLSHTNAKTFFDITKEKNNLAIITHGNASRIYPNDRNFNDEQLLKLKKLNSFFGVTFTKRLVSDKEVVEIDDLIKHINYIVDLIGIDSIGIGSDFGGCTSGTIKELESIDQLSNLFSRLKEVGYSNSDIQKIAGKNLLNSLLKILP